MTTVIVSPPMRRKASALAEQLATFSRGTSKVTGQAFIVVPASNRMTAHWTAVDGSGCTCLGYQRRGTCTHSIAAKIVHDRQDAPAATVAPSLKSYRDLFPACRIDGCTDDAGRAGGLCLTHASEQARALDTIARRELVANA